jgi:hypothetical protein
MAARGGPAVPATVLGRDPRQCHLKSTGGALTHFDPTNLYRMREKCEKPQSKIVLSRLEHYLIKSTRRVNK